MAKGMKESEKAMKLYQHGQLINGNANSWIRFTRGDWGQRAHWRSNCSCNMKRTLRQLSASTATATATAAVAALHALSIRSVGARQLPAPLRPHTLPGARADPNQCCVWLLHFIAMDGHTHTHTLTHSCHAHTQLPRPVRQRQKARQNFALGRAKVFANKPGPS